MTIRDIAAEASVSIATVSRVLNNDFSSVSEETRDKVLEIARRNNYVLPKKRKIDSSARVALIVPQIQHMFFSQMIEAVSSYCFEAGYELCLFSGEGDPEKHKDIIETLAKCQDIQWVLYMGISSEETKQLERLCDSGKKVVLLDNIVYANAFPVAVSVDGEKAMYDLTRMLQDYGHRDIAYITGSKQAKFNNNRHVGYSRAMFERNLPVDPILTRFGTFSFESGVECTDYLISTGKKFTAIVCENDLIAYGAIHRLQESGLSVPGDVSVTGFDDMEFSSYMSPSITTVRQPVAEIVAKSFELLESMSNGTLISNCFIRFPGQIIERDSVRDINQ